MGKFRKKTSTSQAIPTSALPDIIFILLFFFMVTTKMRTSDVLVKNHLPSVTQIQKLERKDIVSYIYIGQPKDVNLGEEPRIQVNDVFIRPEEIPQFIEQERTRLGEKQDLMIVDLKIDDSEEVKLGIVHDVKEQLRKVNARNINFSSKRKTASL